jgi:isocitrate dehydrogenase
MSSKVPITVARGDGIGPEIMEATLLVLEEAGAQLEIENVEVTAAWESLRRTRVFLQAPITLPAGGAARNPSVAVRKSLGLFATVMPVMSYHPYVETKHPQLDLVVIRENEEGAAGGAEYRRGLDTVESLQPTSHRATERIIHYAFHYAKTHARKKVTCFTSDHSLGLTGELFHRTFDEVGVRYPEIAKEPLLIESGLGKLAAAPEQFDVLVLPNLTGDLAAEIAAQISSSVGMVGCSHVGADAAMFEALHGTAPRLAGQNVADPSGLLLAAVSMLRHIGQTEAAERAHHAWLKAIEDGIHTCDIFREGVSKQRVGTKEFAKAVVERLGQAPSKLKPVSYRENPPAPFVAPEYHRPSPSRLLVGVDVVVAHAEGAPENLARILQPLEADGLKLESISNRGLSVWPKLPAAASLTDSLTCRFKLPDGATMALTPGAIVALLDRVVRSGAEFLQADLLYHYDGRPGFTRPGGK